jgi:hypothetical protein
MDGSVTDHVGRSPIDPELHDKLTDGYARLLALDGECVRLVRRITDLASAGVERSSAELTALSGRLSDAEVEKARLRAELSELRAQADPSGERL